MAGSWSHITYSPQERQELQDVWKRRGMAWGWGRDTPEAGQRPLASLGSRMEGRHPSSKDTRGLRLRAAALAGGPQSEEEGSDAAPATLMLTLRVGGAARTPPPT